MLSRERDSKFEAIEEKGLFPFLSCAPAPAPASMLALVGPCPLAEYTGWRLAFSS